MLAARDSAVPHKATPTAVETPHHKRVQAHPTITSVRPRRITFGVAEEKMKGVSLQPKTHNKHPKVRARPFVGRSNCPPQSPTLAHVSSDAMTAVSCFSQAVRFHTSSPPPRLCATSLLGRTAGRADCWDGRRYDKGRGFEKKRGCGRAALATHAQTSNQQPRGYEKEKEGRWSVACDSCVCVL